MKVRKTTRHVDVGVGYVFSRGNFCSGYLILAGRVRKSEEAVIIADTLEKHLKRKIDADNLFTRKLCTRAFRTCVRDVTIAIWLQFRRKRRP